MNYKLIMRLESSVSPGSGEGWAGLIDSDIIFDEFGIPFIPARRIKGILLDNARDIIHALKLSGVLAEHAFTMEGNDSLTDLDMIFGRRGQRESSPLIIENAYIENYLKIQEWMQWAELKYPELITRERVRDSFTNLRQQTAIDSETGTAKEHSLRATRVLNPGQTFVSHFQYHAVPKEIKKFEKLLALSAQITRYLGSKRNRGLGKINCQFIRDDSSQENLTETVLKQYAALLGSQGGIS